MNCRLQIATGAVRPRGHRRPWVLAPLAVTLIAAPLAGPAAAVAGAPDGRASDEPALTPAARAVIEPSSPLAPLSAVPESPAPSPAAASAPQAAEGRPVVSPLDRPAEAKVPVRACSFTLPICVHAPTSVPGEALLQALADAERAMRTYDALGLPRPLPDGDRGGNPSYDLYLEPGQRQGLIQFGQDLRALATRFDTASAFAVITPSETAPSKTATPEGATPGAQLRSPNRPRAPSAAEPPAGAPRCAAASAAAYALACAALVRLAPAAAEGVLAMTASYLASIAAPCAEEELAAIDAFQKAPERAITGGMVGSLDGALLFPWYLDDAYGIGAPGQVMTSLIAIAAQSTPADAPRYRGEPDAFDALRESVQSRGSNLDDLLLDFAVARAFVGSRSDGAHLSDTDRFGDFGRVRFEWSLPLASLPRRVAPLRPIEPTGATYLWLDLSTDTKPTELTFVADWELPALFRWTLVKIDKQGAEAGRLDVAGIFGSNHAQRTVVDLDNLAGLLIVGVNAGSMIRNQPFDPDEAPFMPHSYTVWLSQQHAP